MSKALDNLTDKQRLFVLEYTVDFNATAAARRAGYSQKTARQIGAQNLSKLNIKEALQEAIQERAERTKVDADRVVLELERLGFYDPRSVLSWGPDGFRIKDSADLSDADARIVASVSESPSKWGWRRQIKFYDRLKALELLGKHLGMFTEQVEVNTPVKGSVRMIRIERVARSDEKEAEEIN
jgi:phage terminase small subunit